MTYADKVITFCQDEPGLYVELLRVTVDTTQKSGFATIFGLEVSWVEQLDLEMHALLKQTTELTPWNMVKKVEEQGGFEAWRVLHEHYAAQTKKSRRQMLKAIIGPEQQKEVATVMDSSARWEINVSRFRTAMDGKTVDQLLDEVCVVGYMSMLPDRAQEVHNGPQGRDGEPGRPQALREAAHR